MIITTSQELAEVLLGCCCAMPQCEAQVQCETYALTVADCGFYPEPTDVEGSGGFVDVACELRLVKFWLKTYTKTISAYGSQTHTYVTTATRPGPLPSVSCSQNTVETTTGDPPFGNWNLTSLDITSVVRTQGGDANSYFFQRVDTGTFGYYGVGLEYFEVPYTATYRLEFSNATLINNILKSLRDTAEEAIQYYFENNAFSDSAYQCEAELHVLTTTKDFVASCPADLGRILSIDPSGMRYRIGIPASYFDVDAPRSYLEAQWDEIFFPEGWQDWLDGGSVGEAPGIPSYIISRSWLWGGDTGVPWSDIYLVSVPESPGKTRVVNLLVKCYKSARLGVVPTAIGEVFDVEETPLDFSLAYGSYNIPIIL